MPIFSRHSRGVARQYRGGEVSIMIPRYTTPPERNTREWFETFGKNPRLAVVDRIASDLSTVPESCFEWMRTPGRKWRSHSTPSCT